MTIGCWRRSPDRRRTTRLRPESFRRSPKNAVEKITRRARKPVKASVQFCTGFLHRKSHLISIFFGAKFLQNVCKVGLCGFRCRVWRGRIQHDTHLWSRSLADVFVTETVDDYVGVDNPVRFIDAFVDGLDLAAAGFARAEPKARGRPGYAPADLLKLYIYG